jgi:hypothetical protein
MHKDNMLRLEENVLVRNEREAEQLKLYEQRILQIQEELDMDEKTFAAQLISKLQARELKLQEAPNSGRKKTEAKDSGQLKTD